jgi:hypothetical protein
MFESQFRHKQRRLLRVVSIDFSLGHRNSIGLPKVSLHQRHKEAQGMRLLVRVTIKFLGLVVVMLSCFPSPIGTQLSNAVLSATTDGVEVANGLQRSGLLGFSRVHTPSRLATCSGSSTSEVCSSFPARPVLKFCGSPRTACRAVFPSSKHCQWKLLWRCPSHFNTPADVFVDGPRTTSYPFGCTRLPIASVLTTINSSAFSPCRCSLSTKTTTALKRENRPASSEYMSFQKCSGAYGTAQNILGCSVRTCPRGTRREVDMG